MRRETAIQQNDGMDVMPLELCRYITSQYQELDLLQTCLEMQLRACEPIDLQSERPIMNAVTFYKDSGYIYIHIYI